MDILHLLDRMEEIIKEGRRVPFGNQRLLDERQLWPLLDQMRISVPDELRRAERIVHERERTLAQAKEEAQRIVELARQEAAQLAADHSIARTADQEAAGIREQARQEARQIVAGADEYAFDVLCDLEQELKRALTVIENGIRAIEARRSTQVDRETSLPDAPDTTEEGE